MKQLRPYPQAVITKNGARFLEAGNVWVYDAEVLEMRPAPLDGREAQNGDLVDVVDEKGGYLGTGLLSQQSKIRVRIVSRNANDRFPGLVVDRYGDVLVTESLTVGMERLRPVLFPLLARIVGEHGTPVRGIFERNDARIREKEGLPLYKGWYDLEGLPTPESARLVVAENGVRYNIDVENSQKTGFFLDQKYNRRAVARLAQGRRVLDCFTHVGTFALNCAVAGAEFVHGVDISATAVDCCRHNAELNGVADRTRFTCANVFDLLTGLDGDRDAMREAGGPFDLIVLDPPAFTKNRKTVHEATRGYRQINYRAMRMLPRGGYLATCSCSHFMDDQLFRDVIREAAHDAGVQLRQVEARQQAPDHPIVWGIPETSYLKFLIFQVV